MAGAVLSTVMLLQVGCEPESIPQSNPMPSPDGAAATDTTSGTNLRELTGLPARAVWIQDLGDGMDTGLESANLRLMGLDSEDGRGERAILSEPANYARPLIMPHGDRVLFSDRHNRRIMLVNWDGTGLRAVRTGLALAVWADDAGREWIYYGEESGMQRLVPEVYRCLADNPTTVEPVWERTAVGLNNFQLSGDARRAGGVFPWPECGIAELPGRGLRIYGKGCYPALAPDDSGLFWIFDGAHRNLLFFRADTDERWRVPINTAPEIDGYEVYYPRWSNRARFMVMTGPFKVGTGDNRIRGGGLEVEVYAGRFSADYRRVEEWRRLSFNNRGDFYPDLWVAPAPATSLPPHSAKVAPPTPPASAEPPKLWPTDRARLEFIWENRARPNTITDTDGTALICGVEPTGHARYGRHYEMLISRGAFTAHPAPASRTLKACRTAGAMTLELVAVPAIGGPRPPGVICAVGSDAQGWSLLLGERDTHLACLLRRKDGAPGAEITIGALPPGRPTHISLSYADGVFVCRLNGLESIRTNLPDANLDGWTSEILRFGAAPDGGLIWSGLIEGVALFSRTLTAEEALRNYQAYAQIIARRAPEPDTVTVDARLIHTPDIPAPAEIAPYRRALTVNRYQLVRALEGAEFPADFLVAEWVIMDGAVLPGARRTPDMVYRLRLESFDDHPELEGERLIMEGDVWSLPMYYPPDA
jgi:hypothetical protein